MGEARAALQLLQIPLPAQDDRATIRQGLASLEGVISRVWCHRQTIVRDRDSFRSRSRRCS